MATLARALLFSAIAQLLAAHLAPAVPVVFVRTDYPTDHAPLWIAAADFDHDNHLDLATSLYTRTTISIFLGDGTGGFGHFGDIEVGINPWGLSAGDFNEDGDLDLAVTNTGTGDISILLGSGDGTFTGGVAVDAGGFPRSVSIADFDEDEDLDLAVSNLNDDTVSIHFGNGLGGFADGPLLASGDGPGYGGTGDFNEDGNVDFAEGNQNSDDVSMWLGNGDGAFGPPASLPVVRHAHGAIVGRLNTDAHDDIVADNNQATTPLVSVILGDGTGAFEPTENFPSGGAGPTHLAIADFDLDSLMDLAVANRDAASISVLSGDGASGFGPPQNFAVPLTPQCLAAGDFDEDGKTDLAVSGFGANRLAVLLNRTSGASGIQPLGEVAACGKLLLHSPFPNPARATTSIGFQMREGAPVTLRVVDAAGRPVRVLLDRWLAEGRHAVVWDGRDARGAGVGAGTYFCDLRAPGNAATRKLVVLH